MRDKRHLSLDPRVNEEIQPLRVVSRVAPTLNTVQAIYARLRNITLNPALTPQFHPVLVPLR